MLESISWTLITGAAKGLGAAIALDLAENGHHIIIHYRHSKAEAQQIVTMCHQSGVQAEAIFGDFSSFQSLEQFIQALQPFPIKYLVQNVGEYLIKPLSETSNDEWNTILQTNLHAPFAISKALIPTLVQNQGSIVNIGIAGVGNLVSDTYSPAYRIAKTGLLVLTKSLAKELAAKNVNINMVSPGYMENAVDLPHSPTVLPMQRPASLEEVSKVVGFLLADSNKYITGQNIEVSGGVRL